MADDDESMLEGLKQEDVETEQKIINEEYKTWKKNAPYLYDMILSTALDWPTLTVQWFPDKQESADGKSTKHRLLIGTHTEHGNDNHLMIANVQLPNRQKPDVKDYNEETGEIGGYSRPTVDVKFNIVQKIAHPGEVNKARYQPQNPNLIATFCPDGRVLVWDKSKHSSLPSGTPTPELELPGHTKEGFGLCWNPNKEGQLASASEDMTVKTWDITSATKSNRVLHATHSYTHHNSIVNDVKFHPLHGALLGSVADDKTLQLIDTRSQDTTRSAVTSGLDQHRDAINALAFNPAAETVVATGSADRSIAIWDLRNLKNKLHALEGHNDAVLTLEWHPFEQSILGSSGNDRRVMFWDLSKVGEEQTPEDSEDGPPELIFMHGGHTGGLTDFSFNMHDPWVVCSAADDNLIQVWRAADAIVGGESDDVPMHELET